MRPLRTAFFAIATVAALAAFAGGSSLGSGGPAAPAPGGTRVHETREGIAFTLPPGWARARSSLVPQLLDPREILSAGTGRLRVGAGGNCDRYPMAAMRALGPRDALVSIQETKVSGRPSILRAAVPWPRHPDLHLRRIATDYRIGEPHRWRWETSLDLRSGGRAFWVLIAAGSRSPRLTAQAEELIDSFRVASG